MCVLIPGRVRLSICETRPCRAYQGTVRLKLVVCARIFIKFSFNATLQIPVYTIITLPARLYSDYSFSTKYLFIYLSLIIKT